MSLVSSVLDSVNNKNVKVSVKDFSANTIKILEEQTATAMSSSSNPKEKTTKDKVEDYVNTRTKEVIVDRATMVGNKIHNVTLGTATSAAQKVSEKMDLMAIIKSQTKNQSIIDSAEKLKYLTVEQIVTDELGLNNAKTFAKKINKEDTYNKAVNMYKKITGSDQLMNELRYSYMSSLEKLATNRSHDLVAKLTGPLKSNSITSGIINDSRLNAIIDNEINKYIENAVNQVVTKEDINEVSSKINSQVETIRKNGQDYVNKNLANEIGYLNKLKDASKDKMAELEQQKQKYKDMAESALATQKKKIDDFVSEYESKAAEELNKVIKSMAAGVNIKL